ncbi:nitroreductase [Desulfovibrio sp. X2]|uniref:nitroreductase family protein n=1 Tax=Desulfovibrio sp. X2 TaxID=941449 RepID=UPI000358F1B4|nr:nitroreductase family protein [Desulfovibrio sp. X2]EPR44087.1 nitroreductase [Desulfovibrio sp. X2]
MDFRTLVARTRTHRRFRQDRPVSLETLRGLVDMARLAPSAANKQPLKYVLINEAAPCAKIFAHLGWAAYLKDWAGPAEGERPAAYVVVCGDKRVSSEWGCDHGFAIQNMLLGAMDQGIAACVLGAIKDRPGLHDELGLPDEIEVLLVVAFGEPGEEVAIDELGEDGNVRYWRDATGTHHVPKRSLAEIVVTENPEMN